MARDDLVSFLRSTDLLSEVPPAAIGVIAGQLRPLDVPAGTVLFEEGGTGDAAYLILEGELALESEGVELLRRGPGAFVGEFSLIDEQPRSASGVARTAVRLLRWDREIFLASLAADPAMARGILRVLTRKLRGDVDKGVLLLRERERWRHDLDRAREIQSGMLPPEDATVGDLEAAGHCAPAGAVGGDFYDLMALPDGRAAALIVDVTGHGFYSGLFVAMAKSCLHTQARFDPAPAAVMAAMRRTLALSLERRMLMTCAYVVFDGIAGRLRYANAGHPHPLHWCARARRVSVLDVLDPILGAQEPGECEYRAVEVDWRPGDLLVLYTDGLTEARAPDGAEFGRVRLERALADAAGGDAAQVRDALLAAVHGHMAQVAARDDLTLLVLRAPAGRAAAP